MKPEPTNAPSIPSFFSALRCSCGRSQGGKYCDGSHLDATVNGGCAAGESKRPAADEGRPEGEGPPRR
jgi:CDGSH-type Zn-finger protein